MIGKCFKVNCMSQVKKESDVGVKHCKRGNIRWMDFQLVALRIQMTDPTSIASLSEMGTYLPDWPLTVFMSLMPNQRRGLP